jgi:hypothetical protein
VPAKEKWSKWPTLREVQFNSDPGREPSQVWDFRITINRHNNVSQEWKMTDEFLEEAGVWSDDAHLGKRFREIFESLKLAEEKRAS